jgi:hypothetical protein
LALSCVSADHAGVDEKSNVPANRRWFNRINKNLVEKGLTYPLHVA